jgi:hypothetical protein
MEEFVNEVDNGTTELNTKIGYMGLNLNALRQEAMNSGKRLKELKA